MSTRKTNPSSVTLASSRILLVERGVDRRLGERAHRAADLVEIGEPAEVARHDPQQHALAQPPQRRGERVVAADAGERGVHFLARERRRRRELRGELRLRFEQPPRIARVGDFAKGIGHLSLK
jgi:hypothetical protein